MILKTGEVKTNFESFHGGTNHFVSFDIFDLVQLVWSDLLGSHGSLEFELVKRAEWKEKSQAGSVVGKLSIFVDDSVLDLLFRGLLTIFACRG